MEINVNIVSDVRVFMQYRHLYLCVVRGKSRFRVIRRYYLEVNEVETR